MKQTAIAFDQLLNALIGGMADETLSARAHRMREKQHRYWGWTAGAIDLLLFWQDQHCYHSYHSYLAEMQRRQMPDAYRRGC